MYKLVIVEDEDLLRKGLTTFIDWEKAGYELVGETGDGESGIRLVTEKKPDVLITDIKMPHISGLEMTERLREILPDLKVIIISGYNEFDYATRELRAGVSEYISKPIDIDALLQTMEKLRLQLDQEHAQREEQQALQKVRRADLRLHRMHLYHQLLLYHADPDRLETESPDLFSDDSFYGACLVTIPEFSELYLDCDYSLLIEKDKALGEILDQCLQDPLSEDPLSGIEILRPNRGERILCICSSDGEDAAGIIREIRRRLQEGPSENTGHILVTGGKIYPGLRGLQRSYANARDLLEQHLMKNWQNAAGSSLLSEKMTQCVNALCTEIRGGSEKDVRDAMKEFRDELARENITSFLQLTLVLSNVYYSLMKIPTEIGGDIREIIGDPHAYYQQMIGQVRREDMLDSIEDLSQQLHLYFRSQSIGRKQELMAKIDRFLNDHYADVNLSMKDVADSAFISISYLGIVLRQETGKTFVEYLTDLRVEKAKQLLRNTDKKNYEIAELCGYSTPAYFSTVFKSAAGLTPSEYRRTVS